MNKSDLMNANLSLNKTEIDENFAAFFEEEAIKSRILELQKENKNIEQEI
jgi:hypothetical protein